MTSRTAVQYSVLLYVPNLIGYARLVIALTGHVVKDDSPSLAVLMYASFAALDGIDGWIARRLGQCSAFGAWLDVVVDNIGRTMIWSNFQWGFLVSNLEWITFVCNHNKGLEWKSKFKENVPVFVNLVMANGFKTFYGALAIGGLHVLPVFLYACKHDVFELSSTTTAAVGIVLVIGRSLCAAVEIWCVYTHVKRLITLARHD